jgi:hypothetical protein
MWYPYAGADAGGTGVDDREGTADGEGVSAWVKKLVRLISEDGAEARGFLLRGR